jgi:hypothetical protein
MALCPSRSYTERRLLLTFFNICEVLFNDVETFRKRLKSFENLGDEPKEGFC